MSHLDVTWTPTAPPLRSVWHLSKSAFDRVILIYYWPLACIRLNIECWRRKAIEVTLLLFKGKQEPEHIGSVDLLWTGWHVGQLCALLWHKDRPYVASQGWSTQWLFLSQWQHNPSRLAWPCRPVLKVVSGKRHKLVLLSLKSASDSLWPPTPSVCSVELHSCRPD